MAATETIQGYAGARAGQRMWMAWEGVVGRYMEWRSEGVYRFGVCKVLVKKHRGAGFTCEDGTRIEAGDRIGELHLDNAAVLGLTSSAAPSSAALALTRLARSSMRQVYVAMETIPELADVKALVGVTLLHRGLVHGLGFEQRRLSSRFEERMCALYLRMLLRWMHPEGKRRVRGSEEKLVPMKLIHSRRSLALRFGSSAAVAQAIGEPRPAV